jgi:hypothetical protein
MPESSLPSDTAIMPDPVLDSTLLEMIVLFVNRRQRDATASKSKEQNIKERA